MKKPTKRRIPVWGHNLKAQQSFIEEEVRQMRAKAMAENARLCALEGWRKDWVEAWTTPVPAETKTAMMARVEKQPASPADCPHCRQKFGKLYIAKFDTWIDAAEYERSVAQCRGYEKRIVQYIHDIAERDGLLNGSNMIHTKLRDTIAKAADLLVKGS